jgi:hypothetical protein
MFRDRRPRRRLACQGADAPVCRATRSRAACHVRPSVRARAGCSFASRDQLKIAEHLRHGLPQRGVDHYRVSPSTPRRRSPHPSIRTVVSSE